MTRLTSLALLWLSTTACLEGIEVRVDGRTIDVLSESCERSDGSYLLTGSTTHAELFLVEDRPVVSLQIPDRERLRFTPYPGNGIWLTTEEVAMGFDDRKGVQMEGRLELFGSCEEGETK